MACIRLAAMRRMQRQSQIPCEESIAAEEVESNSRCKHVEGIERVAIAVRHGACAPARGGARASRRGLPRRASARARRARGVLTAGGRRSGRGGGGGALGAAYRGGTGGERVVKWLRIWRLLAPGFEFRNRSRSPRRRLRTSYSALALESLNWRASLEMRYGLAI